MERVNWEYPLEPNEEPYFAQVDHGLVCDAEGNIYFGSLQGYYFCALNKFGELLWKIPLNGHDYASSPAIGSDGTLYIGTTSSASSIENLIAIRDYPNSVEENLPPDGYQLYQNYPNPFNSQTTINYFLEHSSFVNIKVYTILGNKIATIVNEVKSAGSHSVEYSNKNAQFSSGVYIYKIEAIPIYGKMIFRDTKKMILLR